MTQETLLATIALIFGFYASWNIGANDVSNAMGTSVGSKALTLRQAVCIAAIFEFLGAVFFGSHVSETIQRGLIDETFFIDKPFILAYGMLSSLLATGIWLQVATYCGFPVSTTHTIVGAIVGFGYIAAGKRAVYWGKICAVASSWIISPVLGAIFGYIVFSFLRKKIFYAKNPYTILRKIMPFICSSCFLVLTFILMDSLALSFKKTIYTYIGLIAISVLFGLLSKVFLKDIQFKAPMQTETTKKDDVLLQELNSAEEHLKHIQEKAHGELHFLANDLVHDVQHLRTKLAQKNPFIKLQFRLVEASFSWLQVFSACLMAFSHGANDVANAMGPVASVFSLLAKESDMYFPSWILIIGGVGIIFGLATWGWRVIETIGRKITELTPSRGFAAEISAAVVILLASRFGFPISTTHTLVGAVLGVGLAGGLGAIHLKTIRDIIVSWLITIPAGAFFSIGCFYILEYFMKQLY